MCGNSRRRERGEVILLQRENVTVAILDMQLDMIPLLRGGSELLHNCRWLAEAARDFEVPTLLIAHQKLGEFPGSLLEVADHAVRLETARFNMLDEPSVAAQVESTDRRCVVLAGAETHVCIFQSALDLQRRGHSVFVLTDTCSTRNQVDHEAALVRLRQNGVHFLTREMLFFELMGRSDDARYLGLAKKYLDGRYIR